MAKGWLDGDSALRRAIQIVPSNRDNDNGLHSADTMTVKNQPHVESWLTNGMTWEKGEMNRMN